MIFLCPSNPFWISSRTCFNNPGAYRRSVTLTIISTFFRNQLRSMYNRIIIRISRNLKLKLRWTSCSRKASYSLARALSLLRYCWWRRVMGHGNSVSTTVPWMPLRFMIISQFPPLTSFWMSSAALDVSLSLTSFRVTTRYECIPRTCPKRHFAHTMGITSSA